jgi:uncharacterized protein with PQ loop repeat
VNLSQIVGFVGTGFVVVGYIPQIHHLLKERCTAGLSVTAFAVWASASLLFLIHAAMIRDVVFVGVQIVNLAASGIIVAFCKRYEGQVCPSHVLSRDVKCLPPIAIFNEGLERPSDFAREPRNAWSRLVRSPHSSVRIRSISARFFQHTFRVFSPE